MNNFPAMTEEQRQELIRHNRAKVNAITPQFLKEVSPGVKKHLQREIDSAKIAIAALTVPPAPVLRPIDLPKAIQQHETCKYGLEPSDAYGLHWGSKEILSQCIKAIRDAGYEVKQ